MEINRINSPLSKKEKTPTNNYNRWAFLKVLVSQILRSKLSPQNHNPDNAGANMTYILMGDWYTEILTL